MAKNITTTPEGVEVDTIEVNKTMTNWQAFADAGLVPTQIRCDGYFPAHPHNQGCHSLLQLTAEAMINHFKNDHGGGYVIKFRRTDGRNPWPGWKQLADAKMEIVDFRCAVCNTEIQLDPRFILQHMAPHKNSNRRIQPGGEFLMTISDKPVEYDFSID